MREPTASGRTLHRPLAVVIDLKLRLSVSPCFHLRKMATGKAMPVVDAAFDA